MARSLTSKISKNKKTISKKVKKQQLPKISILSRLLFLLRRLCTNMLFIKIAAIISIICAIYYANIYDKFISKFENFVNNFSTYSGLIVKDIYLEGQKHTNKEDITKALNLKIGQPIYSFNLKDIKQNLEQLNWVKFADIERQLPSTILVRIVEKEPVAIWQNQGNISLIDSQGQIIIDKYLDKYINLIIITGKEAPAYLSTLFNIINYDKESYKMIESASLIGNRRWDIKLSNNVKIKLPQNNAKEAWVNLVKKHKEKKILNANIEVIDLRIKGKNFIR